MLDIDALTFLPANLKELSIMRLKIWIVFLAAAAMPLISAAAWAESALAKSAEAPKTVPTNSKVLVVYFSHTGEQYSVGNISEGNTAIIAKMIAAKTGADIFEIIPENPYPKVYQTCTEVAKSEKREKARPAYQGDADTSSYETIFVGYPIWWGDLPMVVYSFLEKHDLSGKTIVPFCTHEGSGAGGTDWSINSLYKGARVKSPLAIWGSTAQNKRAEAKKLIDEWLAKMGF